MVGAVVIQGSTELLGLLRIAGQMPGGQLPWEQDTDFGSVRDSSVHGCLSVPLVAVIPVLFFRFAARAAAR